MQMLAFFLMALLLFFILLISFTPYTENSIKISLFMAFVSFLAAILLMYSTFQKHPSSILISLIGFTKSGKTVFLTMLFNQFTSKKIDGVLFSSYGSETAEEVRNNLNLLYSRKWLPPTAISSVFPFRAIASLESGLNRKNFKIEIDDYAGEFSQELNNDKQVRQSAYIDYVMKSDVIFIAIDGETILKAIYSNDYSKTHLIENFYITALQLIREAKGVPIEKRMKTPVAIIIMKCDLFYPFFGKIENLAINGNSVSTWENAHKFHLTQSIQRLTEFCVSKCSNYEIFFTSAVGKLEDNMPSSTLNPENITQPLVWALHNTE